MKEDVIRNLDDIDKKLLYEIQKGLEIIERPFYKIALKLGITEEEVLKRIKKMKDLGLIRKFGLRIDVQNFKFYSTLLAIKVDERFLEDVAKKLNERESVTHSYLRDGSKYNLWVVVIEKDEKSLKEFINYIKNMKGVEEVLNLPVKRKFKINVIFKP